MKAGKEEIVGLMAAVRWYLNLDHSKLMEEYENQVQDIINAFSDDPFIRAQRSFPSEAGQPHPRAEIIFATGIGITRDEILRQLYTGEPAISLAPAGSNGVYVNPQTLKPGEEKIIIMRLKQILSCS
jgi:L-seryl-tRNA(Ser) seleniumtransferase